MHRCRVFYSSSKRFLPGFLFDITPEWDTLRDLGKRLEFAKNATVPEEVSGGKKIPYVDYVDRGLIFSNFSATWSKFSHVTYIGEKSIAREGRFIVEYHGFTPIAYKTAVATVIYRFTRDTLSEGFLASRPDILACLVRSLSVKATSYNALFGLLGKNNPYERICSYLVMMENAFQATSFAPRLTQRQLSRILGLHVTTTNRILRSLEQEGVISNYLRTGLTIRDPEKLYAISIGLSSCSQDPR